LHRDYEPTGAVVTGVGGALSKPPARRVPGAEREAGVRPSVLGEHTAGRESSSRMQSSGSGRARRAVRLGTAVRPGITVLS